MQSSGKYDLIYSFHLKRSLYRVEQLRMMRVSTLSDPFYPQTLQIWTEISAHFHSVHFWDFRKESLPFFLYFRSFLVAFDIKPAQLWLELQFFPTIYPAIFGDKEEKVEALWFVVNLIFCATLIFYVRWYYSILLSHFFSLFTL